MAKRARATIAVSAAGLHSIRLGAEAAYSRMAGLPPPQKERTRATRDQEMFAMPMPPSGNSGV